MPERIRSGSLARRSPAKHPPITISVLMFGCGILAPLFRPLKMRCSQGGIDSWPHKIIHDAAYLFFPFSFVAFLLLLGGALLITWGRLSDGVLVGFCVTAGILIGLFVICHLALYCTWASNTAGAEKREGTSSSSGSASSGPIGRPVRVESPRICARCFGGLARANLAAPQTGNRKTHQRKLQVRIEEASDKGEPTAPDPASRIPEQGNDPPRAHEFHWSFTPSHPSMIPSPLNLARTQDPRNNVYPFQHGTDSQRQSDGGPGPPGLRIPPLEDEAAPRPAVLRASTGSTDVVTNKYPASTLLPQDVPKVLRPGQADGEPRRPLSASEGQPQRRPLEASNDFALQQGPHKEPTFRDRRHDTPSGDETSSRGGSRSPQPSPGDAFQSPRKRPRGPRPQSTWLPTITGDVPAGSGNRAEGLGQLGPAITKKNHDSMAGQYADVQHSLGAFVPKQGDTQAHMVLIREPDLMDLVARGILKMDPESTPPPWLLRGGTGDLVRARLWLPPPTHYCNNNNIVEILSNAERTSMTTEESPGSVRWGKSHRAQVEGVSASGQRGPSGDSGYCTASSVAPHSASMPRLSGRHDDNEVTGYWQRTHPPYYQARSTLPLAEKDSFSLSEDMRGFELDSWSPRSREGQRRVLRRRSSAPSLGARFRRAWVDHCDGDGDADDEACRPPSRDSEWEDSWFPEDTLSDRPFASGSDTGTAM